MDTYRVRLGGDLSIGQCPASEQRFWYSESGVAAYATRLWCGYVGIAD